MKSDGVPASIDAAWGVRSRSGLSLDGIVAAGIELATEDGITAVSMVKVAKRLGVSTMALYRYVAAKDELLDLMVDTAIGPPPASPTEDWRSGLTDWAWHFLAALRRHPWILRIPISGPPITPLQIEWLEHGLRSLAGTGIAENQKLSVIMLVSGFVRNWAATTADLGRTGGSRPPIDYGAALRRLTDPERFPAVHAALDGQAIDDEWDDGDEEFRFGLGCLLDGVGTLVR